MHPLAVAHSEWGLRLESYLKEKDGYFPDLVNAGCSQSGREAALGARSRVGRTRTHGGLSTGRTAGTQQAHGPLSVAVACGGRGGGYLKEMSTPRLQLARPQTFEFCVCVCVSFSPPVMALVTNWFQSFAYF